MQASEQDDAGVDLYRSLCRCAAIALVAADTDGNVVFWNPAAEQLLDISAAEIMGHPASQVVPPQRRRLFDKLLRRTVSRVETTSFEIRLPIREKASRLLRITLSPVTDSDGQVKAVAGWILDETEHNELSKQLAQSERLASLGTLAGGVAHHFNNILGGVATFVDYALTKGDDASMRRALQMTTEAAARAAKITQSLLSFAEHDTHRSDLADLTEVVMTFCHLVERPLREKNITLELDLKPVPIVPVEANRMHQVLGNLLTNAEEAMPEGGTVYIRVDRMAAEDQTEQDRVALVFADTGKGIPSDNMPQVFEPFFTTKGLLAGGDRENPGLGLSVAHGIITEMGGRISVGPAQAGGAEFTISFALPKDT